jgi:hypothetical protein
LQQPSNPFETGERVEIETFNERSGAIAVIAGVLGRFNSTHAEVRWDDFAAVVEIDMLRRPKRRRSA